MELHLLNLSITSEKKKPKKKRTHLSPSSEKPNETQKSEKRFKKKKKARFTWRSTGESLKIGLDVGEGVSLALVGKNKVIFFLKLLILLLLLLLILVDLENGAFVVEDGEDDEDEEDDSKKRDVGFLLVPSLHREEDAVTTMEKFLSDFSDRDREREEFD